MYLMRSLPLSRCTRPAQSGAGTWHLVRLSGWGRICPRDKFRERYYMISTRIRGKRVMIPSMRRVSSAVGLHIYTRSRGTGAALWAPIIRGYGMITQQRLGAMLKTV